VVERPLLKEDEDVIMRLSDILNIYYVPYTHMHFTLIMYTPRRTHLRSQSHDSWHLLICPFFVFAV
jgi:hypothetical protein